jgi:transposase
MTRHVRPLTEEERTKLERITHAQTAPVRLVRRARIVQLATTGLTVPVLAVQLQQSEKCVRQWIERFNATGLEGLDDAPRSGRPRTYNAHTYSPVIAKARGLPPKPAEGAVPPPCHWTLNRLQAELATDGLAIKRSQIRRLLRAEHLTWQKPRTGWASDAPECAATRGRVSRSTPPRPLAARCSAETSWGQSRPSGIPVPAGGRIPLVPTSAPAPRVMATAGPSGRGRIGRARSAWRPPPPAIRPPGSTA